MNNLVEKILKKLNITNFKLLPYQKGYRNRSYPVQLISQPEADHSSSDNSQFNQFSNLNLIIYKNEKDILSKIKNADFVSDYLHKAGFPTRKSLSKIIKIKFPNSTRYARLYNYLTGETINWEAYTKGHIKLLGKSMAEMHGEFFTRRAITQRVTIFNNLNFQNKISSLDKVADTMASQTNSMQKYFSDANVIRALKEKLNVTIGDFVFKMFEKLITKVNTDERNSILHMDFVRSNILFSKNNNQDLFISGILDFEKVALGPNVVDIARTLAFLIVDCKYKDEKKVRKYFLRSGYLKYGKGKIEKFELMEDLLIYFWFYDFYKFLKHNPYESLNKNEHYFRTVSRLKVEKILE